MKTCSWYTYIFAKKQLQKPMVVFYERHARGSCGVLQMKKIFEQMYQTYFPFFLTFESLIDAVPDFDSKLTCRVFVV